MTTSERAAQDGTTAADLDGTTAADQAVPADPDGTTADQVDLVDGTTTGRAALKDTGNSPDVRVTKSM